MPTPRQKLTKTVVEALPAPAEGYTIFRDAELKGFGVRVMASGVRAYFCERKQYGKTIRTTLGQHGEVSATEARKLAEQVLASIRAGENPNSKRKAKIVAAKAVPVTFGDLAEGYMRERMELGKLKPRTIKDYRADLAGPLATLVGVPATQITRQVIADLQKDLSVNRGPTTANRAMRFARAVFNFAAENEDFTGPAGEPVVVTNPTAVLKTRRLWNQAKRKHGFLGEQDLGRWVDAVLSIDRYRWSEYRDRARARAENVEGYLLVMVCLGLRSGEASALRREDWDAKQQILTIADPKNINTAGKAFAVPVGWRIAWLLDRHAARADGWLFEGERQARALPQTSTARVL